MTALPEEWLASVATRRGPRHEINQDSHMALPQAGLFVVADGMGGHAEGDVASRSITRMLSTVVEAEATLPLRVALVEEAVAAINGALRSRAAHSEGGDIIGSTLAAAVVGEGMLVYLWVGDSRVYRLGAGGLSLLTEDHVLAEPGGESHVLTRAIGSAAHVEIARGVIPTEPGDTLLLCSDGLNKAVPDAEIADLLAGPLEGLAERLVARAVACGGRDDITVVVARRRE